MMSKTRASIFGGDDADVLDVTSFAPKTKTDDKAPRAEQVRAVSQAANFQSREPTTVKPAPKETKRIPRRYRTGRNVQISMKALSETVEAFYSITEQQGWVLVDNLIEHFRDNDRREEFFKEYKEIEMLYEIISPDAFLRPYIDDYTTLSSIYAVVRNAYAKKVYRRSLPEKDERLGPGAHWR
jgi:hypothetical protein